MDTIISIIMGLIVGYALCWAIINRKTAGDNCCAAKEADHRGAVKEHEDVKEKNLQKMREFIKEKKRFTNNDIEQLTWVSDATAERYLEQLEQEGLIRQVGSGAQTYYEKI